MSRFADTLVNVWPVQTHVNQLNGTVGRGEFRIHTAVHWLGVFGHSSSPVNWEIEVELPDPGNPATPTTYKWLSISAQYDVIDSPEIPIPAGAILRVKTSNSPGSNPKTQLVTRLLVGRNQ